MVRYVPRLVPRSARVPAFWGVMGGIGLSFLISCNKPPTYSDQHLQEQAQQAAAQAKEQSKEAIQDARAAAANAEGKVNAIATGVKDGLNGRASGEDVRVDLNTAPAVELALLPGISLRKAKEIVDHRPYSSGRQLVDRGLLTQPEFAAISSKVTVR